MQCIPYIGWKTRGALEVGFESFSRPVDRVMHSLVGSLWHANSLTYGACSNTNLRPALDFTRQCWFCNEYFYAGETNGCNKRSCAPNLAIRNDV